MRGHKALHHPVKLIRMHRHCHPVHVGLARIKLLRSDSDTATDVPQVRLSICTLGGIDLSRFRAC